MKKITDMMVNRLVIDPSIIHDNALTEIITQLKIDVISHKDDEKIILNLYYTLRTYFNKAVVDEILKTSMTEKEILKLDRDYKLDNLGL